GHLLLEAGDLDAEERCDGADQADDEADQAGKEDGDGDRSGGAPFLEAVHVGGDEEGDQGAQDEGAEDVADQVENHHAQEESAQGEPDLEGAPGGAGAGLYGAVNGGGGGGRDVSGRGGGLGGGAAIGRAGCLGTGCGGTGS